ncbi:MAG: type II/IV secretion system protein [Ramlibacter sp.]|nr:type II/IV secretion system protein [Ramlibacter sp.]
MPDFQSQSLGQLLLQRGSVDESTLRRAEELRRTASQDKLGSILIRLGVVSEQTLLDAQSHLLGITVLQEPHLSQCIGAAAVWHQANHISPALVKRLQFIAFVEPDGGGRIRVAARDPFDSELQEHLQKWIKVVDPGQFYLISTRDLERAQAAIYRPTHALGDSQDLRKLAEDAPIVELVNGLLARATDSRASDVHVEPEEAGFIVRYRIDGRLQGMERYSRDRFDAVVSRIKLVSGLDIAERRLPQDGRFSSRMAGVETDVRVSVIPGVLGESLVLRLLPNTQATRFDLGNIGIEPDHLAMYRQWMAEPDGIVLVTGPTGSGKSTTLYATLVATDTGHERVMTVEDPVEYKIPGVTQFQVHPDIGFTFPAALRSILRHDPDTIMIGEIRDTETARIAVQASLTGHRVFSTLHTNDSITAFLRLADMGVEPFLVGATVRGIVAQRLVRRLCDECAESLPNEAIPAEVAQQLSTLGVASRQWTFRHPIGCPHCSNTGYRGRIAIYELLNATEQLRSAMSRANPTLDSLTAALPSNFRDLRSDGLIKAARGITSLEDVYAVAGLASASAGSVP